MKKYFRAVQITFGVPWIIFGIQHFIYADFVAGLVPQYFPARYFWGLFAGAAMFAAGLSFIFNKKPSLAAVLLAVMMLIFVALIHVPTIAGEISADNHWTRALQDISFAAIALMLAEISLNREIENEFLEKTAKFSRDAFAVILIIFGIEHFLNLDFLVAKVPDFLPLPQIWNYLTGAVMTVAGACVLINKKAVPAVIFLGWMMLLTNLLYYGDALIQDLHNPLNWTAAMLDLALTAGVFILAISLSKNFLNPPDFIAQ